MTLQEPMTQIRRIKEFVPRTERGFNLAEAHRLRFVGHNAYCGRGNVEAMEVFLNSIATLRTSASPESKVRMFKVPEFHSSNLSVLEVILHCSSIIDRMVDYWGRRSSSTPSNILVEEVELCIDAVINRYRDRRETFKKIGRTVFSLAENVLSYRNIIISPWGHLISQSFRPTNREGAYVVHSDRYGGYQIETDMFSGRNKLTHFLEISEEAFLYKIIPDLISKFLVKAYRNPSLSNGSGFFDVANALSSEDFTLYLTEDFDSYPPSENLLLTQVSFPILGDVKLKLLSSSLVLKECSALTHFSYQDLGLTHDAEKRIRETKDLGEQMLILAKEMVKAVPTSRSRSQAESLFDISTLNLVREKAQQYKESLTKYEIIFEHEEIPEDTTEPEGEVLTEEEREEMQNVLVSMGITSENVDTPGILEPEDGPGLAPTAPYQAGTDSTSAEQFARNTILAQVEPGAVHHPTPPIAEEFVQMVMNAASVRGVQSPESTVTPVEFEEPGPDEWEEDEQWDEEE